MRPKPLWFFVFGFTLLLFLTLVNVGRGFAAEGRQTGPGDVNLQETPPPDFSLFLPLLANTVNAPELAVASLQISPNPVVVGEDTTLDLVVSNFGMIRASSFSVYWYVYALDGIQPISSGEWSVSELPANTTLPLQVVVPTTTPGPFTVRILVDPSKAVPDPVQSNNTKTMEMGVLGVIDVDETTPPASTWAYATYLLHSDLTVPVDTQLTLRNGAVVKPDPSKSIQIDGTLEVTGTADLPLIFTSSNDTSVGTVSSKFSPQVDPVPGDWPGFVIKQTGRLVIDHAIIRYGLRPFHIMGGSLTIMNSLIEFSSMPILSEQNGVIDFQNNMIRNMSSDGLVYQGNGSLAPILMGNTFENNAGYAAIFDLSGEVSLDGSGIVRNTATNNLINGIRLSGSFYRDNFLGNAGIAYVLMEDNDRIGSVHVAPGASMTILPGAVLKSPGGSFWYGKGTGFEVEGSLNVIGTETQPVIFTSMKDDSFAGDTNADGVASSPAAGDWTRLLIRPGGSATIDHAIIRYSGGGVSGQTQESIRSEGASLTLMNSMVEMGVGVGIRSISNGFVRLENNQINNHAVSGLECTLAGIAAPVIKNNSFNNTPGTSIYEGYAGLIRLSADTTLDGTQITGNTAAGNRFNGIGIAGTLLDGSILSNAGIPFILPEDDDRIGSISIPAGSTLTIQPGTIFKMQGSSYWYNKGTGFEVLGTLNAIGTELDPIVFTSLSDDTYGGDTNNNGSSTTPAPGNWTRLLISPGGTVSLDHTIVLYSGGGVNGQSQENIRNDGGKLIIKNSTLAFGAEVGIRNLSTAFLAIENSTLDSFGVYGILYSGTVPIAPTITDSVFLGHTSYPIVFDLTAGGTLDTSLMSANSASGNGKNGARLWGSVAENSTLTDIGFPFVLSDGLTVASGKTLSILPNVVIKFAANQGITVNGVLDASGLSTEPVVFTSIKDDLYGGDTNNDQSATSPLRSDWNSLIAANGGVLDLTNAQIRYGGWYVCMSNCYGDNSALHLLSGGTANLDSVTVYEHGGYGILVEPTSTSALSVSNSTIDRGDLNGICANQFGNSGLSITDTTINNHNSAPIKLNFNGGSFSALSGLSGTANTINGIQISGTLGADATLVANSGLPYIIDGSLTILNAYTLQMAEGVVVKFNPDGTISVEGAVDVNGSAISPVVFTSLKDDSAGGDTNNDGTSTSPARSDWNAIIVANGKTLAMDYAELRYGGWQWCGVNCYGNLTTIELQGSATAELNTVKITQSGGTGIHALGNAGNAALFLNNVDISANNSFGVQIENTGVYGLTILGSRLTNNTIGLLINNLNGIANIIDSNFLQNTIGVSINGSTGANISNCIFEQNVSSALNNTSGNLIIAENNWWNSATGPRHASNPIGTGDVINGVVDFEPWLTTRPR